MTSMEDEEELKERRRRARRHGNLELRRSIIAPGVIYRGQRRHPAPACQFGVQLKAKSRMHLVSGPGDGTTSRIGNSQNL